MPENAKEKNIADEEWEEIVEETDKSPLNEEQKMRSYYYDDACGYEIYNADEEEKEDL
jgi:hypothetical protein